MKCIVEPVVMNCMHLPVYQVRKGQPRPTELLIQPNTEVMQGELRGQERLQFTECMGPFSIQAKGMMKLVIACLYNGADVSEPALQRLGSRRPPVPLGQADDLSPVGRPPRAMISLALKALVNNRETQRGRPDPGQTKLGLVARGKKRLRQRSILGAGRPNAKAGDHSPRVHRQQ
jgi:hypothetical protein